MSIWSNDLVSLRRCSGDDWPLLHALLQDEEGYYLFQTRVDPPCAEATAQSQWEGILSLHEEDGRLDLAILPADAEPDDEPVGLVSLSPRDERGGVFTAPIFLLPEYRGEGLGRAALSLLLAYAFRERRIHKLQATILADNAASVALHESLGFRLEGTLAEQHWHNGHWCDELWYGMTERAWFELNE